MVREIPNSNDWRTDTDNPMVNAFRELMMENNQYQDDPYVGIFWYDVDEDDLFGVVKTPAKDSPFYKSNLFNASAKTCSALHYKVWQKGFYRGKDKRFQGDYTKVPRGRIFEVDGKGFIVAVGEWINEYPSAKDIIIDEFQLPENTEFMIDYHWNIGHGWSDKDM